MKLTALIIELLDREAERTRKALKAVPAGHGEWKPHPKSIALGQLAKLVAIMPSWISAIVLRQELDIKPKDGKSTFPMPKAETAEELIEVHDQVVAQARQAVRETTDEHLVLAWKLFAGGQVAMETTRYLFIMDNFMHLAHHRGQLTVYLRMNEIPVPAIYGPSADDNSF
jgi:uncharacterized damage-inducible protein DinB